MNAQRAETSDRYEKIDENVFQMKPIGGKPRRRILTNFGQTLFNVLIALCIIALAIYAFAR